MRRICGDRCIDPFTSCPCEPGELPCGPVVSSGTICIPQFCAPHRSPEPYCRTNTEDNKQRCAEACFKYDQTSGALSTTQYPAPYLNNQDCDLDLSAPEGYQIFIQFHDFQIDSSDFFTLYDGLTEDKNQLYEKRKGNDTTPYLSSDNNVKLTFKTGSSKEGRGFNTTVQFIKVNQCDKDGRCVLKCPLGYLPCNGYCVLETFGCRQQCLVFNQTTMTVTRQIGGNV